MSYKFEEINKSEGNEVEAFAYAKHIPAGTAFHSFIFGALRAPDEPGTYRLMQRGDEYAWVKEAPSKKIKATALKPCPFCGGSPALSECCDGDFYISCTECKITTLGAGDFSEVEDAVVFWNTRAPG